MKKEMIKRGFLGAPIGVFICVAITIIISLFVGDGNYYPVVPELAALCGTEVNAVLIQTIVGLLYGAMFGAASVIWDMEEWSLLRQTVSHLLIVSITTLPIAYVMHWMEHSLLGALAYMTMFLIMYAVIWGSTYLSIRNKLKKINTKVKAERQQQ